MRSGVQPRPTKRTQSPRLKSSRKSDETNPKSKLVCDPAPLDDDRRVLVESAQTIILDAFTSHRSSSTGRPDETNPILCQDLWRRPAGASGRSATKRTQSFGPVTGRAERSQRPRRTLTEGTQFPDGRQDRVVSTKRTQSCRPFRPVEGDQTNPMTCPRPIGVDRRNEPKFPPGIRRAKRTQAVRPRLAHKASDGAPFSGFEDRVN
jgi:hypothetical protein